MWVLLEGGAYFKEVGFYFKVRRVIYVKFRDFVIIFF